MGGLNSVLLSYGAKNRVCEDAEFAFTGDPPFEPVSVEEMKTSLVIHADQTRDDVMLGALISSVRRAVEKHTGLSLIQQGFEQTMSGASSDVISIRKRGLLFDPVITYLPTRTSTVWETWTGAYRIDSKRERNAKLVLIDTLPAILTPGGLKITGTIGSSELPDFGPLTEEQKAAARATARAAVPGGLRDAIRMWVGFAYENREGSAAEVQFTDQNSTVADAPPTVWNLIKPYINWRLV